MSTKRYVGHAPAVAQVQTASIDSVDGTPANNTFTVTIGTVTISEAGDTDVATTATNLRASLNASTHPYFAAITWSGTGGDIIGTADSAGMPFIAALSKSGAGSGTVTDFAMTTANSHPSDASVAANWSDGALPVDTDIVILDTSVPLLWGLDFSTVDLAKLDHRLTQTGAVGLPKKAFTTAADGSTTDASVEEYRQTYLKIGWDLAYIGRNPAVTASAGNGTLRLHNTKAGASMTHVFNVPLPAATPTDNALCLLSDNAAGKLQIRSAAGGVGIGVDDELATSAFDSIGVFGGNLQTGPNVSITSFHQQDGRAVVFCDQGVTLVNVAGGICFTEGQGAIESCRVTGGVAYLNNAPTSGDAVGALYIGRDGSASTLESIEARQFGYVQGENQLLYDDAVVVAEADPTS